MPRLILIDEFHVTLSAVQGLPQSAYAAMYRRLNARSFHAELRKSVVAVLRRYRSLCNVRVRVTR